MKVVFAGIIIVLTIYYCRGGAAWELINPYTTVYSLTGVWAASESELFAVGQNGCIVHWDGQTWQVMNSGTMETLYSIWGLNSSDVYAGGLHSTLLHWNGFDWSSVDIGIDDMVITEIWASSSEDIYIVGSAIDNRYIVRHWNGVDWEQLDFPGEICHVWGLSRDEVFLGGDDVWFWDGISWTTLEAPSGSSDGLWASSPDDLYAIINAAIYHWDGIAWTEMIDTYCNESLEIWGSSANDIWVGGGARLEPCSLLHWDGTAWQYEADLVTKGLGGANGSTYLVTYYGQVYHIAPGSLVLISAVTNACLNAIWGIDENHVYVISGEGLLLFFDGVEWNDITDDVGFQASMFDIWGTANDDMFCVGKYGKISHFDGVSWQEMESGQSEEVEIVAVSGSAPDDVYAAGYMWGGSDGLILHWDGFSWSRVLYSPDAHIDDIWVCSKGKAYAVGSHSTIFQLDNNVWIKMAVPPSDNSILLSVWGSSFDNVFAVREEEVLHWDGEFWKIVYSDVEVSYFKKAWGVNGSDAYFIKSIEYDYIFHWDGISLQPMKMPDCYLLDVWGASANDVYAVGEYGCIMHWDGQYPLGVRISCPQAAQPGESFQVRGYLDNPGESLLQVPVFFILDIYGEMWFWDDWTHYCPPEFNEIDFVRMDVPNGTTKIDLIPPFIWTDIGQAPISGLYFYGAMLNNEQTSIVGDYAAAEWGYAP